MNDQNTRRSEEEEDDLIDAANLDKLLNEGTGPGLNGDGQIGKKKHTRDKSKIWNEVYMSTLVKSKVTKSREELKNEWILQRIQSLDNPTKPKRGRKKQKTAEDDEHPNERIDGGDSAVTTEIRAEASNNGVNNAANIEEIPALQGVKSTQDVPSIPLEAGIVQINRTNSSITPIAATPKGQTQASTKTNTGNNTTANGSKIEGQFVNQAFNFKTHKSLLSYLYEYEKAEQKSLKVKQAKDYIATKRSELTKSAEPCETLQDTLASLKQKYNEFFGTLKGVEVENPMKMLSNGSKFALHAQKSQMAKSTN